VFYSDPTFLLLIPVLIFALYAQNKVRGNYEKYKKVANSSNLTGAEAAELILRNNGVLDVEVVPVEGVLTDHYHPGKKQVNLSRDIFYGRTISAISIAAHEVGHALQHNQSYAFLQLRASILPMANIGSSAAFPLFFIGFLFQTPLLMDLGIVFFAGALAFHLITLPVEYNASARAFQQLQQGIIRYDEEMRGVKAVLNAAALTYVASTLMALMQLLRMLLLRGSRR
jgi:Zn-dependent membrane protease YugP